MKEYKDLCELLKKVQATGGMDCDQKSICDYQDMIGHSSEEQLADLANGIYKEAFYRVYGISYGTIEAIRFHCKHGEKIAAILEENDSLKCDYEALNIKYIDTDKKYHDAIGKAESARQDALQKDSEIEALKRELEAIKANNTELKAKLYDLMTA